MNDDLIPETPHFYVQGRIEAMNAIGAQVVSTIANIEDATLRRRLSTEWGELSYRIIKGLGVPRDETAFPTESDHLQATIEYAQKWCEQIRVAIMQDRMARNARNN